MIKFETRKRHLVSSSDSKSTKQYLTSLKRPTKTTTPKKIIITAEAETIVTDNCDLLKTGKFLFELSTIPIKNIKYNVV